MPLLVGAMIMVCVVVDEVRTSVIQSWLFSRYALRASYALAPGPSTSISFPASDAPYDRQAGYALLSDFQHRLEQAGFRTVEQSRFSPALLRLAKWGIGLPYPEPYPAGLLVEGASHDTLFNAAPPDVAFHDYQAIPDPVVKSLLFIENKELDDGSARRNPVIEWGRFFKGMLSYGASRLGLPIAIEGGSTLAIQLEKYRHSPSGRTGSGVEKLRQMLAASVRVYRRGPDTREERRRIILDYLNSMPLAAAPGYGEVQGLGEGLRAWYGIGLPDVVKSLAADRPVTERAWAFKRVLGLLCAVRAPTAYLLRNPAALERRVSFYTRRLAAMGIIDPTVAQRMEATPLPAPAATRGEAPSRRGLASKATTALRVRLQDVLGVPGLYELDRLHLTVRTTLDRDLQDGAETLLANLADSTFLWRHGLLGKRLLSSGDPRQVVYSVLLFEKTREGNAVRVQADNLSQQLDLNDGMKLELGSTAKLRVLAHYLELVEGLYRAGPGDPARSDPVTIWAAETLRDSVGIGLPRFLELALERQYSANPWEVFFTGGGIHTFHNFDSTDDRKILSVREALERSNNLVFVRLMRDLVQYHETRLSWNVEEILNNPGSPERRALLTSIAPKDLDWLLLHTRAVRRAQDQRLKTWFEQQAFLRMTPAWKRLGFPFDRLVPSLATAIGSSADRPAALAELVGILMNDGVRKPVRRVEEITFAAGTPYHTVMAPDQVEGERVMSAEVSGALRGAMAGVVSRGTAIRADGALTDSTGLPLRIGGKTGSGDNRFQTFGSGGWLRSSRAINRTASFVFYAGDRYFGVITAFVPGAEADAYTFTSSLPVAVFRLLAPALQRRLGRSPEAGAVKIADATAH